MRTRSLRSICIACGSPKDSYQEACANCEFEPQSHEDLAKSRILSEPWDFGLPDGGIVSTGRTSDELASIAETIRSGGAYDYPADELEGMIWVIREAESMTGRDVLKDLIAWLAPPLGLAAVVWYLIARFG